MPQENFSSPITYQAVSQKILEYLDSTETGCVGDFKREVVTRIMALSISFFQFIDLLWNTGHLLKMKTAQIANHMGYGFVPQEELESFSFEMEAAKLTNNAAGVVFGSACSVISPRCFVPFCFAPDLDLFENPDPTVQYPFNNHFQKVYVINLKNATEKLEVIDSHLKQIGVQYERFDAINGYQLEGDQCQKMWGITDKNRKARLGCYLSHLNVLRKARDENLESVLILEDDAVFPQTQKGKEAFEKGMQELPKNWEILHLGFLPLVEQEPYSSHLNKTKIGVWMHSYAVHRNFYDTLISYLEDALEREWIPPVDSTIAELLENRDCKAFTLHPQIGYQRQGCKSNITGLSNDEYPLIVKVLLRVYTFLFAPMLPPEGRLGVMRLGGALEGVNYQVQRSIACWSNAS